MLLVLLLLLLLVLLLGLLLDSLLSLPLILLLLLLSTEGGGRCAPVRCFLSLLSTSPSPSTSTPFAKGSLRLLLIPFRLRIENERLCYDTHHTFNIPAFSLSRVPHPPYPRSHSVRFQPHMLCHMHSFCFHHSTARIH